MSGTLLPEFGLEAAKAGNQIQPMETSLSSHPKAHAQERSAQQRVPGLEFPFEPHEEGRAGQLHDAVLGTRNLAPASHARVFPFEYGLGGGGNL
jgi:hypothetical protein